VPAAGYAVEDDGVCTVAADDATVYGTLRLIATRTFAMGTKNAIFSAVTNEGTLTGGTSSGAGLTCAGFNSIAVSVVNLSTNYFKWTNSGNFTIDNSAVFTTTGRGILIQTGSGNGSNPHFQNYLWHTIINAGSTLTLTGNFRFGSRAYGGMELNGVINTDSITAYIGCGGDPSYGFTLGTNGDITGAGTIQARFGGGGTVSILKSSALSFTGIWLLRLDASSADLFPAMDTRNATVRMNVSSVVTPSLVFQAGTTKIGTLDTLFSAAGTLTVANNTNNPSLEIYAGLSLANAAGTLNWTKGTGTITFLNAADATAHFNGKTVEDLIINATATKKVTLEASFTTDSLTLTNGVLVPVSYLITSAGSFSAAALAKIICSNANGLVGASGSLTGFSDYTWTGGVTIELTESITWDGTNIPDFASINYISSGSGKTQTVTANYGVKSLSGTAGSVVSNVAGTQRRITVIDTSVCTGMTFKDISTGAANKINAKSGCTNNGNCKGIVFTDTFGEGFNESFPDNLELEYLIAAGAGGGGDGYNGWGCGGGAGGLLTGTKIVQKGVANTITVGAGGAGGVMDRGSVGSDSTAFSLTAEGGGGGGSGQTTPAGSAGGSGGGSTESGNPGGAGTVGQGYDGGNGLSGKRTGGGGSASEVGEDALASLVGGAGGDGVSSSITGSAVYYCGGGGSGGENGVGEGGLGGGGDGQGGYPPGATTLATDGSANTGGGGGGAGYSGAAESVPGKNGGSGVVILRFLTAAGAGYSTTGSPTVTTDGSYTVVKYTGSGSFTA
jgi:hypothetical protein